MKRKVLIILLVLVVLFCSMVCLTGCSNKEDKKIKEESQRMVSLKVQELIEEFADSIENDDKDKFIELIDFDSLELALGHEVTQEELEDLYLNSSREKYEVSNIKFATKDDVENVLKFIGQKSTYDEIRKKFVGYDLYEVTVSTYDVDEMKDIFLIKKDDDEYLFGTSFIWLTEIELAHDENF